MAKMIVVDIDTDGSIQVDAQGFKGTACDDATQKLELLLNGGQRAKSDKKPEYHMPSGNSIRNTLKF